VLILIVCTSVALPTFFLPFYGSQFDKHGVAEDVAIDKGDLMDVTRHMLGYMNGRNEDLVVFAVINGEEREFFNQREKDHMVDVRDLFEIGFIVRNIAFFLLAFLVLLMAFLKINIMQTLARCCREVTTGFLLLAAILVAVIAMDFDRAFTVFHLLFFDNDLWILNPATDLLIRIVPIGFFTDISAVIGGLIAFMSAAVIFGGTWYLHKAKPFLH
jgi:integral membrane protein (TIGR01906 family)